MSLVVSFFRSLLQYVFLQFVRSLFLYVCLSLVMSFFIQLVLFRAFRFVSFLYVGMVLFIDSYLSFGRSSVRSFLCSVCVYFVRSVLRYFYSSFFLQLFIYVLFRCVFMCLVRSFFLSTFLILLIRSLWFLSVGISLFLYVRYVVCSFLQLCHDVFISVYIPLFLQFASFVFLDVFRYLCSFVLSLCKYVFCYFALSLGLLRVHYVDHSFFLQRRSFSLCLFIYFVTYVLLS